MGAMGGGTAPSRRVGMLRHLPQGDRNARGACLRSYPSASSIPVAAMPEVPSIRCAYTFIVMPGFACPRYLLTTGTGTLLFKSKLAVPCLNWCGVRVSGNPARLSASFHVHL